MSIIFNLFYQYMLRRFKHVIVRIRSLLVVKIYFEFIEQGKIATLLWSYNCNRLIFFLLDVNFFIKYGSFNTNIYFININIVIYINIGFAGNETRSSSRGTSCQNYTNTIAIITTTNTITNTIANITTYLLIGWR